MKKTVLLFAAALLLFSCKSKNNLQTTENEKNKESEIKNGSARSVSDPVLFFEKTLLHNDFSQIKINSKLDIENNSMIPTMAVTTYIEKDKKIWMNLSALFVNAARGIATPEGVKGMNKLERTYIDSNFDYLNKLLNVNFIDYKTLEKLLMGRTFLPINQSQYFISENPEGYKLASVKNQKITGDGVVREYKTEMDYDKDYHLVKVLLEDVKSEDALEIIYSNWQIFNNIQLPGNVKINIKGSKSARILMENTKFDDSKMATPFSVPENYSKIEIK